MSAPSTAERLSRIRKEQQTMLEELGFLAMQMIDHRKNGARGDTPGEVPHELLLDMELKTAYYDELDEEWAKLYRQEREEEGGEG